MLKCKKCGQSDFGVIAKQIIAAPFRLNSEGQTPMGDSETSQEVEYTYCFGCNSNITQDDLFETVNCATCGKETDTVIEGNCPECNDKIVKAKALEDRKKALNKMTKAELIEMLLSGEINQEELAGAMAEPKQEAKKETKSQPKKEAKSEPKQEAKEEPKKEVVEEVPNSMPLGGATPDIQENADAGLEHNTVDEDDFLALDTTPDVPDVEFTPSAGSNVLDILDQIENTVDINSLNLQNENINEQL